MAGVLPEKLPRVELERLQRERLAALVRAVLPSNRFYARKFADAGLVPDDLRSPTDLKRLPLTTKAELVADQSEYPPYGSNLTFPLERYCRLHQTSGTSGRPLRWLDTPDSWAWMLDCWATKFRFVQLRPGDRLFFPFSFGPFLGFWTAFDSASRLGYLCLPGGGMGSTTRLRFLLDNEATIVLCTPTYALRLAEVARAEGIELAKSSVRALIVAGEPGGSIPATWYGIESAWGARVFDHSGMTEIGPMTAECVENPGGIHVLEHHYLVEVIDPATGRDVPAGTVGELVVTNLGRWGSPLFRYRTGDLVRVDPNPCPCGCLFRRLDGGIRGRADDMIVLRGNNVHPGALQTILHRFVEVVEYRLHVERAATLPMLRVEIEVQGGAPEEIAARVDKAIRDELLFRAEVRTVPAGTLPRFEMKAQRVVKNERLNTTDNGRRTTDQDERTLP